MSIQFSKGLPQVENFCDGSNLRILIIHARWNMPVIERLVTAAIFRLTDGHGVKQENITVKTVPGSYELPFAAQRLINLSRLPDLSIEEIRPFDAVICIGILIKGSTMHFEYICEAVTQGITRVGLDTGIPVIFGVLTVLNDEQAFERAGGNGGHNHGLDWASAACEMAHLKL